MDGNYKGMHAPAEDCLLKPHDVERWTFKGEGGEEAESNGWGRKFTRGKEALPVYNEVKEEGIVPGYEADYDPNHHNGAGTKEISGDARWEYDRPPEGEPILEEGEDGWGEEQLQQQQHAQPPPPPPTPLEQVQARDPNSGLPYDAQREREALTARNQKSVGWKAKLNRGVEMASLGVN